MEIRHEEAGGKGRWVLRAASGHEAEMTYSRVSPGLIILDHTGVPDVFRGRGLGQRLHAAMLATVRREGWKVIPLCPFAAAQFRRHPEDADVLETPP
ncbi:MAG: GNAT family N-acetyltransferase [Rhodobacteraceae bacterium]|nr:GNAT family N-acetyltransferase [Paracoccaceae bacterium]